MTEATVTLPTGLAATHLQKAVTKVIDTNQQFICSNAIMQKSTLPQVGKKSSEMGIGI